MGEGITIRLATGKDTDAIRECARQAYGKYVERIGKPPAPMLADFKGMVAAGNIHLLEHRGSFAGYVTAFALDGDWHLDSVAILPQHRGAGLGRMLIGHAEELGRKGGYSRITLYTNAKMTENLSYYPKLGYAETGRRTEDGYDRVFFAKPL